MHELPGEMNQPRWFRGPRLVGRLPPSGRSSRYSTLRRGRKFILVDLQVGASESRDPLGMRASACQPHDTELHIPKWVCAVLLVAGTSCTAAEVTAMLSYWLESGTPRNRLYKSEHHARHLSVCTVTRSVRLSVSVGVPLTDSVTSTPRLSLRIVTQPVLRGALRSCPGSGRSNTHRGLGSRGSTHSPAIFCAVVESRVVRRAWVSRARWAALNTQLCHGDHDRFADLGGVRRRTR
ncbi:hypothetical protein E2C01_065668 [Portunus trituberculatus]|uniref:Uncharacterized protein n=1 Tax=Portunus trituberculatus TaxID=210409 RepID=A0A5B7HF63_PORTR|nr:hypothetical protein [Portunus trituberculatus]